MNARLLSAGSGHSACSFLRLRQAAELASATEIHSPPTRCCPRACGCQGAVARRPFCSHPVLPWRCGRGLTGRAVLGVRPLDCLAFVKRARHKLSSGRPGRSGREWSNGRRPTSRAASERPVHGCCDARPPGPAVSAARAGSCRCAASAVNWLPPAPASPWLSSPADALGRYRDSHRREAANCGADIEPVTKRAHLSQMAVPASALRRQRAVDHQVPVPVELLALGGRGRPDALG